MRLVCSLLSFFAFHSCHELYTVLYHVSSSLRSLHYRWW